MTPFLRATPFKGLFTSCCLAKRLMDAISDMQLAWGLFFFFFFFSPLLEGGTFECLLTNTSPKCCPFRRMCRFSQNPSLICLHLEYTDPNYNQLSCLYWIISAQGTSSGLCGEIQAADNTGLGLGSLDFGRVRNNPAMVSQGTNK